MGSAAPQQQHMQWLVSRVALNLMPLELQQPTWSATEKLPVAVATESCKRLGSRRLWPVGSWLLVAAAVFTGCNSILPTGPGMTYQMDGLTKHQPDWGCVLFVSQSILQLVSKASGTSYVLTLSYKELYRENSAHPLQKPSSSEEPKHITCNKNLLVMPQATASAHPCPCCTMLLQGSEMS